MAGGEVTEDKPDTVSIKVRPSALDWIEYEKLRVKAATGRKPSVADVIDALVYTARRMDTRTEEVEASKVPKVLAKIAERHLDKIVVLAQILEDPTCPEYQMLALAMSLFDQRVRSTGRKVK
jgi:hypothetical protein